MIQTILTRFVVPLIVLLGGIGAMWLMGAREQAKRDVPPPADSVAVQTLAVLPHDEGLDIEVDGVVTPHREIKIAGEVSGRVAEKDDSIRAGKFVEAGTPLVTIDKTDYTLEWKRAKQQLAEAEEQIHELGVDTDNVLSLIELADRDLNLQKAEFERTKKLFEGSRTSRSQLDQADRAVVVAENAKKTLQNQLNLNDVRRNRLEVSKQLAQIQVDRAWLDVERTDIASPKGGVIVSDNVEKDGYVRKGDILFVLEDTSSVEVQCKLRMDDLYWIWRQANTGDDASVALQALAYEIPPTPVTVTYQLAGRKDLKFFWRGELSRYESIGVDERTRTVPCRVVVDEPRKVTVSASNRGVELTGPAGPPALVRGMYVTVHIHAKPFVDFVKVPISCVHPGKRVWRIQRNDQDEQVLERLDDMPLAKLLEEQGSDGEIQQFWLMPAMDSGLAVGDQLVSVPVPGMRAGVRAELLPPRTETSDP